jgi:putative salt-induced outer membrane protein YdiY
MPVITIRCSLLRLALVALPLAALQSIAAAQAAPAGETPPAGVDSAAPTAPPADTAPPVVAPPPPPPAPAPAPAAPPPPAVEEHTEKISFEEPKDNATSLNASAGGSLNTGNTRAYQLNAGADLLIVRNPHSLAASGVFAYGRAALPDDPERRLRETIKSFNAKARYNYFLFSNDSLFVNAGYRWDPFAGLNYRIQGQAGYGHHFIREEKQRFWGEVGYDITGDRYHQLPGRPAPDPRTALVHSVRLFFGYDNQLNPMVTYLGGIEGLVNVEQAKDTRINFDNALRSAIDGNFKVELKFRLAWDNVPVPKGIDRLDTQTLISLLYTLI